MSWYEDAEKTRATFVVALNDRVVIVQVEELGALLDCPGAFEMLLIADVVTKVVCEAHERLDLLNRF